MNDKKLLLFLIGMLSYVFLFAQTPQLLLDENTSRLELKENGIKLLQSPAEGLWSIAFDWEDNWPTKWKHAKVEKLEEVDEWKIFHGKLELEEGHWELRDAYRVEGNRVKCIRRFEWKGEKALDKVSLSVRWQVPSPLTEAFMPAILYYGNPSGETNQGGKVRVPEFHGNRVGEKAFFEEHRFPMPFANLEWKEGNAYRAAALHTLPSPVYRGHQFDQWWSLGVESFSDHTELSLLSGAVSYNGKNGVVKALQREFLPYEDTYMEILPGTIVEKTFYLELQSQTDQGRSFQQPIYTSIDIFKPFYLEDLPTYEDILKAKYRFTKSRWSETDAYAGFNMFPDFVRPRIVMGWAGQSEAPSYALQALQEDIGDEKIWEMVQKATDHLISSPIDADGFPVVYEMQTNVWKKKDPVSQGQALNSIGLAILEARKHPELESSKWKSWFQRAIDMHVKRILSSDWNPRNTAEAFYISPMLLAFEIFEDARYREVGLKVADYYGQRHITMEEPYWGGTLDATCEDKEGSWGAFQGFLKAYDISMNPKYLDWAQHAADVTLSYTVVWDIPLPAGRMADHQFKTRGWTAVSPQNQHLDVYGVLIAPSFYRLGVLTENDDLKRLAKVMYRSCGQMIDPLGKHGEQLQHTNFAQQGEMSDVFKLRGGYSEDWTVYWITAHFLHAAAQFKEMGVDLDE
ncbi:MAG: hypothetical protein AAGD28_22220 [Bacteroidota bacterium]